MAIQNITTEQFITFPDFFNQAGTQTYLTGMIETMKENWVNPKYLDIPFTLPDSTFGDGGQNTNFLYKINFRQTGYKMDDENLSTSTFTTNNPQADNWMFNLQHWYFYPMQFNMLATRVGSEWATIFAKQNELAMQWLLRTSRNLMRYRIKQTILATRNYKIAGSFDITTANIDQYAYNIAYDLKYKYNSFVSGFNTVNYGIDEARVQMMMSYDFETTMTQAAKLWGGSDAAFRIFRDARYQDGDLLSMRYQIDQYLGNTTGSQTLKDAATGITDTETLDLSNLGLVLGIVGGLTQPSNPMLLQEWKTNPVYNNMSWMWNIDLAPIPWLSNYFYGIFTSAPTLTETNTAYAWMLALSNGNRFFVPEYAWIANPINQATLDTLNTSKTYAIPTTASATVAPTATKTK